MFDTSVILAFVPSAGVAALQTIAVPVLRQHSHDDVLPELPEGTELLPQYTLIRPGTAWAADDTSAWTADAADGFAAPAADTCKQHEGLIVTASRCRSQLAAQAGVYTLTNNNSSGSNRCV